MKKRMYKIIVLLIGFLIMISGCRSSSINNITLKNFAYSSPSPKGQYSLKVYTRGEEELDDAAVLVKVYNHKRKSERNIFWQGNTPWAYIVWKSNNRVCINGVELDVNKGQYDYRKCKQGKSFYQKEIKNTLYLWISSYGVSEKRIKKEIQKKDTNVNYADQDGNTLLMLSAYMGRKETYKELLKRGADINKKNHEGQGVLEFIIRSGLPEKEILSFLNICRRDGAVVTAQTFEAAYQPFQYLWRDAACNYQVIQWVRNEISGDKIKYKTIKDQDIMFLEAAQSLKKEAKKNELSRKDQDGNTLLMISAGYGNLELTKNILAQGVDTSEKNRFGKDCLLYAISKQQWKVTEELLKRGIENSDALLETSEMGSIRGADLVLKYLDLKDDWHLKQAIMNALDLGYEEYAYHLFLKMNDKDYKGNNETVREKAEEVHAESILKWFLQ